MSPEVTGRIPRVGEEITGKVVQIFAASIINGLRVRECVSYHMTEEYALMACMDIISKEGTREVVPCLAICTDQGEYLVLGNKGYSVIPVPEEQEEHNREVRYQAILLGLSVPQQAVVRVYHQHKRSESASAD